MVKRQVQQGLLSYRDADGTWRHALSGENVDVDPSDLERFDKLNGPAATPKKRVPRKVVNQEPSPTSRRSVRKAAAKAAGREPTPKKTARK